MYQPISWTDLSALDEHPDGSPATHVAYSQIGVWGLGVEGRANVARLEELGVRPVVVDDHPTSAHTESGLPVLATHLGGFEALSGCAVVIKAPGISMQRAEILELLDRGVRVVTGLGLWLADMDGDRVVTVTGTKGKSTTTSIMHHLATGLGLNAFLGGNIGIPPWDPALNLDRDTIDLWIIEVSSYQAASLEVSPAISVVTSLAPDHLPWHGSEEQYYHDKLLLTSRPGAAITIASNADANLHNHADQLGGTVQWVDRTTYPGGWSAALNLIGMHNHINANLARAALETFLDRTASWPAALETQDQRNAAMEQATSEFEGLAHRLEHIGRIGDVDFIDDGLSTNVLPTLAAVTAFPNRRVALIAGGFDRDLNYQPLAEGLLQRNLPIHVVTVYATGPKIRAAIHEVQVPANPTGNDHGSEYLTTTSEAADLEDAVRQAFEFARPDGVVLLSPAAASFDAFTDYQHRSNVFREAVSKVAQEQ